MMRDLSAWIVGLKPSVKSDVLSPEVARLASDRDIEFFVRLWLTEGIPHAFNELPAYFEAIRQEIASSLSIDPKEVSLTGSARIGFSLNPKKYLRPYDPEISDLDIFIVSENLFNRLKNDFDDFKNEVSNVTGEIPKSKRFWKENVQNTSNNISRGFIDTWKIPNYSRFPTNFLVGRTISSIEKMTKHIKQMPRLNIDQYNCGLRVYCNWKSAVSQIKRNVIDAIRYASSNNPQDLLQCSIFQCPLSEVSCSISDVDFTGISQDKAEKIETNISFEVKPNFAGNCHITIINGINDMKQISIVNISSKRVTLSPLFYGDPSYSPVSKLIILGKNNIAGNNGHSENRVMVYNGNLLEELKYRK